ncbi:GNAT family N-acetyltransferase [Aliarcobacter butzleri]|uniref:GNAT family N-acetyltransferase n=1 Tax=Aliarcobacter butzleri TaxID=28197 RepID=UPI002B254DB6|nr:GNAT family N-acetyltransferase [Aliarcobacter butzleri]
MTAEKIREFSSYNLILEDIQRFYPEFRHWYSSKVIPGLVNGSREILTEYRDERLIGIAIVKNTQEEKKICTIKVLPEYQNKGIGIKLFKRSLSLLNTNKPFVTVPEERFNEFHKIFTYYGFQLTQILEGYYREGKKEYIYNGTLSR